MSRARAFTLFRFISAYPEITQISVLKKLQTLSKITQHTFYNINTFCYMIKIPYKKTL